MEGQIEPRWVGTWKLEDQASLEKGTSETGRFNQNHAAQASIGRKMPGAAELAGGHSEIQGLSKRMRRLMQVFTLRSSNSGRERPSGSNLGTPELRPCADGLEMDRSKADAVDRSACLGHCPPSLNREEGSQQDPRSGAGLKPDRQTDRQKVLLLYYRYRD